MPKLTVFNNLTLDGCFAARNGDFSWAHAAGEDPEWKAFVSGNAHSGGVLVFGRVTYELMAGYWPTAQSAKHDPAVAERINALPKVVFSRTLTQAAWNNTRLISGDLAGEIRRMKQAPGADLTILGSGSLVGQLTAEGLIDEFQVVLVPVVLGEGRSMFEELKRRVNLELLRTRVFRNGNVLLCYRPRP